MDIVKDALGQSDTEIEIDIYASAADAASLKSFIEFVFDKEITLTEHLQSIEETVDNDNRVLVAKLLMDITNSGKNITDTFDIDTEQPNGELFDAFDNLDNSKKLTLAKRGYMTSIVLRQVEDTKFEHALESKATCTYFTKNEKRTFIALMNEGVVPFNIVELTEMGEIATQAIISRCSDIRPPAKKQTT